MNKYKSQAEWKHKDPLTVITYGAVKIGNRLYAHKKNLDKWLESQVL